MKDIYYLNQKQLPTIPVPHDGVIKEIHLEDDYLIFVFEDDISYHDSIKSIRPDIRSLIMKFHFVDNIYDINLFVRKKTNRVLHKAGGYKEYELSQNKKILTDLTKNNLEYLYHNVGYCSIIIKLWSYESIIFDITSDYVELEWIE